jgi:hypothetical protein
VSSEAPRARPSPCTHGARTESRVIGQAGVIRGLHEARDEAGSEVILGALPGVDIQHPRGRRGVSRRSPVRR